MDTCLVDTYAEPALGALATGGVIVYPTDTVYGLGADATNAAAVALVRRIKGREAEKPILALVSGVAMLARYARMTPLAHELARRYLPGPLTLVLEAKDDSLAPIAAGDGSVGFRIPAMPFCLLLAQTFDRPITSTSVNASGMQQQPTLDAMLAQIGERAGLISVVCDAGTLHPREPSTIVDARGETPIVLRSGSITIHIEDGRSKY